MQMIIIGDSGVGKTSFMDRFVEGNHQISYNATVGIDFKVKRMDIDGKTVKLQIWDTAGQEKFNAITTAYYRIESQSEKKEKLLSFCFTPLQFKV